MGAIILGAAIALIATERIYHGFNLGFDYSSAPGGIARVMFSFFAGVAVARLHKRRSLKVSVPSLLILIAVLLLLWVPIGGRARAVYQLFCIILAFPALIYVGANAYERRPGAGALLGDASYAAYVLHWPILLLSVPVLSGIGLRESAGAAQLVLLVGIVTAASIAHRLYDIPTRSRFFGRRADVTKRLG